jgi:hypothetical protein
MTEQGRLTMPDLCIRCGAGPATRAWAYCEPCWLIVCEETPAPGSPPAEPHRPADKAGLFAHQHAREDGPGALQ